MIFKTFYVKIASEQARGLEARIRPSRRLVFAKASKLNPQTHRPTGPHHAPQIVAKTALL